MKKVCNFSKDVTIKRKQLFPLGTQTRSMQASESLNAQRSISSKSPQRKRSKITEEVHVAPTQARWVKVGYRV